MLMRVKAYAAAAALAADMPGAAMAEYGCAPRCVPYGGVCQPIDEESVKHR